MRPARTLIAAALVVCAASAAGALEPVGGPQAWPARRPCLSRDGERVVFETTAKLVPEDNDRRQDVYLVDLATGAARRMPRSKGSLRAGGATISGDGRFVAYHVIESEGKPQVPPLAVILLHDLETGRSLRIPPGWYGQKADGEALYPDLGRSGRIVAFTSNAPSLVVKREHPVRGVFVYEPESDRVRMISRSSHGTPANRPSAEARLSADGRFVGFISAATNMSPPLSTDSLSNHLYVVDRSSGSMIRVDIIDRGFDSSEWIPGRFEFDDDGEILVFEARARKPGKPADSLRTNDLFVLEQSSGAVSRLTTGLFSGHSHSPSVSGNGRWVAFIFDGAGTDPGGVVVYDRRRDLWRRIASGRCANPSISGDGRFVAFESDDKVITGDKVARPRVYVEVNPSYETEVPDNAGD